MTPLLLALPFAWAAHWVKTWGHDTTFALCFIAMIPLQKIFDWGGEQLGEFLKEDLRDLVVITLSNAVEATLSIILLLKCELRLLQSTIVGVVLLHLLLIPGMPIFLSGARHHDQPLHAQHASVNTTLLMVGVLSMLVPTALFAALDRGSSNSGQSDSNSGLPPAFVPLVSDTVRRDILSMSRGISVVLIVAYIVSRIYHHGVLPSTRTRKLAPPARRPSTLTFSQSPARPAASRANTSEPLLASKTTMPVHPWASFILLVVAVALMAPTAEFLVSSIEDVQETSGIQTEWFGLILLPVLSFSGDGVVAIHKFLIRTHNDLKATFRSKRGGCDSGLSTAEQEGDDEESLDQEFAHARPIDLSIQFTLWWMPFLVLLGWWTDRPMHLLFDYFEVAVLFGASFLVICVLSDSKTNMSEGLNMVSFYVMIAIATWFYPGQPQIEYMLNCPGSVAEAVARAAGGMGELAP
ncbi:uncharacterized protein BXZ73DRAFT_90330 [Epithele typhae]|uniref:uncharacterized protein n=1 Tax=Epithele typhae TaxID=378194 RepID=UPI0020089331|nr:uncharacterized protein BXZ73DRAFT_90330 [Epithele typhae]KAH9930531.1 hypothetical protein BXZ73DRAFT_90330 [Epithele typhae]